MVTEATPQEPFNVGWRYAKAGLAVELLQEAISREAAKRSGEPEARGIANLAWSLAAPGPPDRALLDLSSSQLCQRSTECGPQEIGTTAWASSTSALLGPSPTHVLGCRALLILEEFETQNPTNLAWTLGTLALPHETLFNATAGAWTALALDLLPLNGFVLIRRHSCKPWNCGALERDPVGKESPSASFTISIRRIPPTWSGPLRCLWQDPAALCGESFEGAWGFPKAAPCEDMSRRLRPRAARRPSASVPASGFLEGTNEDTRAVPAVVGNSRTSHEAAWLWDFSPGSTQVSLRPVRAAGLSELRMGTCIPRLLGGIT